MKKINELRWKSFLLGDLFVYQRGNQNNMNAMREGNIPLVSAKKDGNGYKSFISENNKQLYNGHCITLNNDGDGGAGLAYYQPSKMALDSHVTALVPKTTMSKHTMLFIARSISMQRSLFGHGRSISSARLRVFRLMLPIDEFNNPDFKYMENYMKSIERRLLEQYKDYLLKFSELENGGGNLKVNNWKPFSLNEICEIKPGVRLVSTEMIEGKRPFIGATDSNNGLTNFIANTNASLDSNVLGVNYNGNGVAIGFYHPYEAVFTDDVKRIKFKQHIGNKYVYLFLKAAILKQKSKYQYGYKFSGERMNRQKITLPATDNGIPDFEYMEKYMRNKETKLLLQYIQMRLVQY